MTKSPAPHPFSIPNYRYLWLSRLTSMVALYALLLILGWQAYNLAREDMGISASAGILGLLGLLQFVMFLAGATAMIPVFAYLSSTGRGKNV